VEGELPTAGGFSGIVTIEFEGLWGQFFDPEERLAVIDRDRGLGGDATWLRSGGAEPVGPMDVFWIPAASLQGDGRRSEDPGVGPPTELLFFSEWVRDDGPPGETQVFVYDPGLRSARPLTVIERAWLYGDTVRTRDTFEVGRDGRRIIVFRECETYPGAASCEKRLRRVIDVASGAVEVALDWREPVIGPKSIVAGSVEDGVAFLDEAGELHRWERSALVAVLDDHVLVEKDGALVALWGTAPGRDSTAPKRSPAAVEGREVVARPTLVKVSPAGRTAAVVFADGEDGRLGVWRDGAFGAVGGVRGMKGIVWVYEDGVTLARTDESLLLVGANRAVLGQWPTSCGSDSVRRGERIWVGTCDPAEGVGDRLVRVDLRTGEARTVATGRYGSVRYQVSANGGSIAVSLVPVGGERRVLYAGAVSD
jgi:hypothetical protein